MAPRGSEKLVPKALRDYWGVYLKAERGPETMVKLW